MSKFARPNIRNMDGYSWGEQPEDSDTIKLNTNENPYPPSPAVEAALAGMSTAQLRVYPQPTADALRDRLAALHDVGRDNLVITNGGDEALRLALTTFVSPGACFGMAEPSYSLYPVLAAIHDAEVVRVDLEADWRLPDDSAARFNEAGAQLVCLVNPHAPSGVLSTRAQLQTFAESFNGVLLIDEAYADFVDPGQGYASSGLVEQENVLILKTFSKGYGLAGLRLGYLLGHGELIRTIIEKTRDSYNIDSISQILGCAAIDDQPYARQTWDAVRDARQWLAGQLGQLGLRSSNSQANFLLVEVESGTMTAQDIYLALKKAGILVRYFNSPRLDNKLRITIGTPEQNERLVSALTQLLT